MVEDKSHIDVNKIYNRINQMTDKLPSYKQRFSELTIDKMRQEQADEALEGKWKELNMGIDQWKHKYLYPFGNIAPIDAKTVETQAST